MRKLLYFITLVIVAIVIFSSCVTKQQYQELEKKYKECTEAKQDIDSQLANATAENKDLTKKAEQLNTRVEALKADTLDLAHKLARSESDYAKMKRDYDALSANISQMSKSSSATINELTSDLDSARTQLLKKEKELLTLQEQLEQQREELQATADSLDSYAHNLAELQNILNQKDQEVKALKDKVSNALKNFEGTGLRVEQRNGKVYVSMDEKLLFQSAKWDVQGEGKAALQELAKVLEADTTINVLIEGHTDNLAYNGSGQVKDNWDLSVMRATSVVKLILQNGDINPQRISASGRGEFVPVDSADTKEARAKNRRTEIILTPKLDELFQIIDNN